MKKISEEPTSMHKISFVSGSLPAIAQIWASGRRHDDGLEFTYTAGSDY
ncbi:MAG: hypothetical protein P8I83_10900 [Paracoccaceae bacterium]|nr:hypothetical protein [Paracoccaceae bacterium]